MRLYQEHQTDIYSKFGNVEMSKKIISSKIHKLKLK